jgi:hypothetical protein
MRRRTATRGDKRQRMFWINSQLILANVCGVEFVSTFAHLMHCSGQTHQCQPGKAEVNLSTALKHWLLRYQAQDEAMDQQRHK